MELTIAVAAIVIGMVALAMVLPLRGAAGDLAGLRAQLDEARRDLDVARGEVDQARASQEHVRQELDQVRRELDELKAATEVVPVPPLPKTRPGGLDDLRQQLRAAHRESGDEPTPEEPTSGK